ncbi:hypothetical protein [Alteraurantiacibacter buctensis]|uniref:Uncharacterized protein n=1 Tax=Alteraurantiacibacter buctensis TaxID=1503981 RepID=A0A844YWU8_9SPHN|nr:hypothetical protein [Alteraurantiacibacter buctensis]MXO70213.1 hypothetical protein [Alteraurantiacibacter buctensis]
MTGRGEGPKGGDRRQGDRRQHQVDKLPFADRRNASRRSGQDRRASQRD